MTLTTVRALVQTIEDAQLLDSICLKALRNALQYRFQDPLALARDLLNRNWLTAYQVNQLFQGKLKDLQWGPYRLLERLGEGGMGKVFKAWHPQLDRIVALKILHKVYLFKSDVVARFRQEIQAVAQLSHPNIVLAFDAAQERDGYFLAMEYVEGTSLGKLVERLGPLPISLAADFVRQAARGLQHAHEQGLVHRDIKPSNLLVTCGWPVEESGFDGIQTKPLGQQPEGRIKIIDFGLALLQQPQEAPPRRRLTRLGTVMGTPDFIAPEQVANTRAVDIRADLYSLGATFYFLLTGQVPHPGGKVMEKMRKHQTKDPIPPGRLRTGIPHELDQVVRKLMAKAPDDRYQAPGELAVALERFLEPEGRSSLRALLLSLPHQVAHQPFELASGMLPSTTILADAN
jgi:serine/threonine-protein kinase